MDKATDAYDQARELYARLGKGGRVGFGVSPALLVVDLSRGFTVPEGPIGSELTSVVDAAATLADAFRDANRPVFFSTVSYAPDLSDAGVWLKKIPANAQLIAGSEWIEVDQRLKRRDSEPLIVKRYPSCFFGTDLVTQLISHQVDTLLVVGVGTSGCVRASVVDACSYGLRALIVREAIGDQSELSHEASLIDMDAKYGDVISLQEALAWLADHPGVQAYEQSDPSSR